MPTANNHQVKTREAAVTLGGKSYTIHALPMKAAREWRERFGEPLQIIIGVLRSAGNIQLTTTNEDGSESVNLDVAAGLLQQVGGLLLGSIDLLNDALFDYSPELQRDREWIEENADDTEALAALWGVLQLAYPFGNLVTFVNNGVSTIGRSRN